MRTPLPSLILAIVSVLAGCHAQTPVAPPQVAATTTQCVTPGELAQSFAVDWPSDRRGDIEIALKRDIVVMSATCSAVRILPSCSVNAGYAYLGTTEREELVSLESVDDVKTNLPLSAASLTGPSGVDFQHGASLDIGLATVGRRTSTRNTVLRSDLKGECEGATHFVYAATMGAFAMGAGTGKAKTAAEVFGGGGSRSPTVKDGALDACRAGASNVEREVAQCGAPVKLQLNAIREPGVVPKVTGSNSTCPAGTIGDESGACAAPRPDRPHICIPTNLPDCLQQCDRGSPTSCAIVGRSYALGRGVPKDLARATQLLEKACSAGATVACGRLGELALATPQQAAEGLARLAQACSAGWEEGCRIAGAYAVKHAVKDTDVVTLFRRACDGGQGEGCWSLSQLYLQGPNGFPTNDVEGARWMSLACDGDAREGCTDYALLLDAGRGVPADPARAVAILTRGCDAANTSACGALAKDYFEGHSVPTDAAKGMALLERACSYGDAGLCFIAGQNYQLGTRGPKDPAKAAPLFTKACAGGIAMACAAVMQKP